MRRVVLAILISVCTWMLVVHAQTSVSDKTKTVTPDVSVQTASNPKKTLEDCACESQVLPDALAIVNGVKISRAEIDRATKEPVTELQSQFINARKRELDLQINSKLLSIEANRRGISISKLLEQEVIATVKEPTQPEAQTFYEQNKTRIQGTFEDVREEVVQYLRNQRQQAAATSFAERLRRTIETAVQLSEATPSTNAAERGRVMAVVNGEKITSADIEDSLLPMLFDVQTRVYQLRKVELDLRVNDTLLAQEAHKRGITTNALLDAEIKPKTITEEEARAFHEQNKTRVSGDFAQTKDAIIRYLQQIESRKADRVFVEKLRAAGSIQIFLLPPESPVFSISTVGQPFLGNETAPVTIVEFTDYQCSSCAATHPTLARLVEEYGGKVRLVTRDFPLSQHPEALKAAEAAEAAREQGKYWEYVEILLRNQTALGLPKLKEYASELALDRVLFDKALESGKFTETVQRDIEEGVRLRIDSTPTIFVNGRRATDISYEALKATVETTLKALTAKTSALSRVE